MAEPTIFVSDNLEIIIHESLGEIEGKTSNFVVIDIYDQGNLVDTVSVSQVSELWPHGAFSIGRAGHRLFYLVNNAVSEAEEEE